MNGTKKNPDCHLIIPGTYVMCGEEENFCSQQCLDEHDLHWLNLEIERLKNEGCDQLEIERYETLAAKIINQKAAPTITKIAEEIDMAVKAARAALKR